MQTAQLPATRPAGSWAGDLLGAVLWIAVIVPPSFGFWLVASDLAGVPVDDRGTLVLASLLALGIATLGQVALGYRMPVFEGPASTYLGAVAVLAASAAGAHPAEVTGGLLAAGALVAVLAASRADRALRRLFTPPVLVSFLLVVVIAVVPATLERAIGRDDGHPWGIAAAWISAAVVVAVALGGQRLGRRLRPFSLLASLLLGTLVFFVLSGFPEAHFGGAVQLPDAFPWGSPEFSAGVVIPFLIAGALASFNTIASIQAMADARREEPSQEAMRRGLAVHGGAQALTACFGNILGNVPRLDSVGVVRMLGNARPQALGLAAVAIVALAFFAPAVEVLSLVPVAVSASLLAVVLGMLAAQGLSQFAGFDRRRRWLVVAPSVAPTVIWLVVGESLSETAQLLANPLLVGVVLAVVLERLVPRGPAPATAEAAG